jgi:aspartate 4-decarboxylase
MSEPQITEVFKNSCEAYYEIFTDKTDTGYKYRQLSPVELENVLIKEANKFAGPNKILNAGRENPNFLATMPRYAFSLLQHIATVLAEQEFDLEGIGMNPSKKGLMEKFNKLLRKVKGRPEAKFLIKAVDRMRIICGGNKDAFIQDLVISALGSFYPDPSRIQKFAEPVLTEFLSKTIYKPNTPLKNKIKLFPTEGSSAATVYIFNSLKYNGILVPGDSIGILTPISSPYLEFPTIRNYNLTQVCIQANEHNNWEIEESELQKLADNKIRALFLANPTNPSGLSLSAKTVRRLAAIVHKSNPNLIIIADNSDAPFVETFNSLFNALPKNTIGIYSFSKYFGATGWRLATIAIHDSNIIDSRILKNAPPDVNDRYRMNSLHPERIKFIDRLLIDSRQVAESHTAGLSTPQQTFMCICAMHDLIDTGREYNNKIKAILRIRMEDLLRPLEYKIIENDLHSNYYLIIDIIKAANGLMGGDDFGQYIYTHRDPFEFLIKLAKQYRTICLPSLAFAGPFWGIRISLANLNTGDYEMIGQNIRFLIDEYYIDFKKWEKRKELIDKKK